MNWTNFQTYGMAPDKAFEVLCNQLFENWSKEEYKSDIASIRVVNGAGGDGGVESYATLKDGSIIGLQAKWFPTSMVSSQIAQLAVILYVFPEIWHLRRLGVRILKILAGKT